jgi:hypothetical protein
MNGAERHVLADETSVLSTAILCLRDVLGATGKP